jgi:hypothetical protein
MLHEMVHQWQAETGLPVDHGPGFRRKAREVGVLPTARRHLAAAPPLRLSSSSAGQPPKPRTPWPPSPPAHSSPGSIS